MKLTVHSFELPLAHEFRIARGGHRVQTTLIVELEHDGRRGYGEATTSDYYGHTIDSMTASLESVRSRITPFALDDPESLWAALDPLLADDRFAQSALDQAAHDLWGKLHGRPVYEMWGLAAEPRPASCITIGIDTIDVMLAKLHEFDGWPIIKIKLGTERDIEIVQRLRQESDAVFRVDANCGWTLDEARVNAAALAELGVEFIEQPLPAEQGRQMAELAGSSPLPIVADESCRVEADVARCHEQGFHGINIKLVKCGGLTPARRMIAEARRRGLSVMVGCMTESSVGVSNAAQLLPLVDYADLDGPLLLARDIARGVTFDQGKINYAQRAGRTAPGSGIELI